MVIWISIEYFDNKQLTTVDKQLNVTFEPRGMLALYLT